MPETITPGQIDIEFWKVGFQDERVLYEFTFTWDGGQEAEWSWDISMSNPDMSVMSSAPFYGNATWSDASQDVEITYSAADFGEEGEETFGNAAPDNAALDKARAILAEDLDTEGDSRRVAASGWENDEVFVLAFDNTLGATADEGGSLVPAGWDPGMAVPLRSLSWIRPPDSCGGRSLHHSASWWRQTYAR